MAHTVYSRACSEKKTSRLNILTIPTYVLFAGDEEANKNEENVQRSWRRAKCPG
jgi:hypothetical protein